MITLTESHLSDGVSDNEISLDGWYISRCDRKNRIGGGVITVIKDHLTVSDELSRSDSITEYLCCVIHEINMAVITIYRPPDCPTKSFSDCLDSISEWISNILSKRNDIKLGFK